MSNLLLTSPTSDKHKNIFTSKQQIIRRVDLLNRPGFRGGSNWASPGLVGKPGYDLSLGGGPMSTQRFTPEFKEEAVRQVIERVT